MKQMLIVLLASLLLCSLGMGQIPQLMSHQGYVADSTGTGITGILPMTFRMYDDSTAGSLLLTQSFPSVALTKGVFNVNLDVSTLSFTNQYWLETEVNSQTLAPRTRLTSAPYSLNSSIALQAQKLLGPASTATGLNASAGGTNNQATGDYSVVGGGWGNTPSGNNSTIGGGELNSANGSFSTIGGGNNNSANGLQSTVPGGKANSASGNWSFAAGRRAKANHAGTFVWGDGTDADFASTGNDQFLIRASGGVGIGTTSPATQLHVLADVANAGVARFDNVNAAGFAGMYVDSASQNRGWFGHVNSGSFFAAGGTTQIGSTFGDLVFSVRPDGFFQERMRINTDGNVGIGTTTPGNQLDIVGAGAGLRIAAALNDGYGAIQLGQSVTASQNFHITSEGDGNLRFWNGNWGAGTHLMTMTSGGSIGIGIFTPAYKLEVNGDINAIGSVRSNGTALTSDVRFKKNIATLSNSLEKVIALRGVTYDWRKDEFPERKFSDEKQVGFIAQELEKIFPELVSTGTDGYKGVDYARLTPVLVEAIKEQQKEINELKALVKSLAAEKNGGGSKSMGEVR